MGETGRERTTAAGAGPFGRALARLAGWLGAGKRHPARPEGYHLVRWFTLVSLACVLVSGAGTSLVLSRFLTTHMLERDAEVSAEFLESIVRAEQTWMYFVNPAQESSRVPLESFFNHVARLPGVVRANVFSADGTILWSSNAELIGRRFEGNHELEDALRGRIVVESGDTDDTTKAEHVALDAMGANGRFMEAYLPVWDRDRRRVLGAVEIYRLPDALFRAIDSLVRLIWIAGGLSALLLYGALTWIVARARATMLRQQEQLREAEALAAIGAIASAVAHGIRNPLASIRSSAELAALEFPAAGADALADIQREADRMEGWVQDLLQHARGEPLVPELVDVAQLLTEAGRRFSAQAERRGVQMSVATLPQLPVRANAGPLVQAFDNLIANAIEAMPDGGPLRIAASLSADGRMAEIVVADGGTGLPAQLGGMWPPMFFSTKAHGTGLGLVLTRRIMERYEGTMRISSAPGQGTQVTVLLPVAA